MLGIGKKTAWNAWNAYPKVTNTFVAIIQDPSSIILDSLHMRRLERWNVLMYSKNCDAELLNDAMKVTCMFTHSLKSLDSIPPTQHALFQHIKRALLAAVFIWKQSLSKKPKIPKFHSQPQSVGTILGRSGRCQSRMFTAPPLWLCRGLQGQL